jgi:adenosylcobyric acid synthase
MVCGTSSGAGKSFLTTALARWYAQRGFKVAPFKAQNMSNNARVVAAGEIGSAQYFQALAARSIPDVRMNPVLLKPETDTRSQVIVLGRRQDALAEMPWRARAEHLWPTIERSLHELLASHDVVVIEGAGSPAEINLQSTDIVNMRVAEAASAATLIISDVDRGGAFAHLYGTYQLLEAKHRALIRGFVLNKFRGDAGLLAPGPEMLEALTGVALLGVLPMWRDHGLPDEDGVFDDFRDAGSPATLGGGLRCAIVAYPQISNLDEFSALLAMPGVRVVWARDRESIVAADVLVLPGSKRVAGDLAWLRSQGLDAAIAAHVAADKPTLAICGGLQMLGHEIRDPHEVEGAATGLGLLPYATEFQPQKRYRREQYGFGALDSCWAPLTGLSVDAYEIRHGATQALPNQPSLDDSPPRGEARRLVPVLPQDCGWQYGQTLALYVHGLFENAEVLRRLFGSAAPSLDENFDRLAAFVDTHIGERALLSLMDAR